MKSKILFTCIGMVLFIGCAEKNISKKIDEESRASMKKTYQLGEDTQNYGNKLGNDIQGTLKQSVINREVVTE